MTPIPIKFSADIERLASWEGITKPSELAAYLSRVLFVDAEKLMETQQVIFSDEEPTGDDQNKIWIKTSEPIGIGIPSADKYSLLYRYPANIPLLWVKGVDDLPSYMRALTEDELTKYGLTNPENANRYFWSIFIP